MSTTIRTAHLVVPQAYVVLTALSGHTLAECKRADAHNRALYRRRLACVQSAGPGLSCDPVEEPPAPDNTARYQEFLLQNTPVEADRQARAIEALSAAGYALGTDYAPHKAIEFMRANAVRHTASDAPADAFMRAAQSTGPVYKLYSDDELRRLTPRTCLRADRQNDELYRQASSRCRQQRKKLGPVARVHMADLSQSKQSNYQRKILLKSRDTLVSALEQAQAVEALYRRGLRLYSDYEPQNAITLRAQCDQLAPAPSPCPPPPSPCPPPPSPSCPPPPSPRQPLSPPGESPFGPTAACPTRPRTATSPGAATRVRVRALAWPPPQSVKPASHSSL